MILRGFIRKEIIQALRDARLRVTIIVMPVIQLLLFGYALNNDVKNIHIAMYAQPHDVVMQEIYDNTIASKWFVPVAVHDDDPYEAIRSGHADVVLVPPPGGFDRSIGRGEGKLQVLINATNVLRAQAIEGFVQSIIHTTVYANQESIPPSPLNVSVRVLYNSTMDTTTFTVPGMMAVLLTILVMMLTCTSIAKEKESGTFETILSAPIKRRHIILGKTIPFALLGLLNVFIILFAARMFFDLPFRGSLIAFSVASLFFVYAGLMCGIWLSTFVKNQQQSMLCCFIFLFVMLMLSGSFFPVENMPYILRACSYINPVAHYTFLIRNILLKGGDIFYLIGYCSAMFVVGSLIAAMAFKRFHITLN